MSAINHAMRAVMATKKVKIANPLKRRNPAAASLSDPKFRPRIVRD
jgi:hypothetical protein